MNRETQLVLFPARGAQSRRRQGPDPAGKKVGFWTPLVLRAQIQRRAQEHARTARRRWSSFADLRVLDPVPGRLPEGAQTHLHCDEDALPTLLCEETEVGGAQGQDVTSTLYDPTPPEGAASLPSQ